MPTAAHISSEFILSCERKITRIQKRIKIRDGCKRSARMWSVTDDADKDVIAPTCRPLRLVGVLDWAPPLSMPYPRAVEVFRFDNKVMAMVMLIYTSTK